MNSSAYAIFLTVALAHFLALLSPGPDFLLIVKTSIKNGGRKSTGIAAGISSANAIYIALCIIGIGHALAASLKIMIALKVMGGLFLIYLAAQALRAKKGDYKKLALADNPGALLNTSWGKEFLTGFMSGILNPKNLLFYLGLFSLVLTGDVGLPFKIFLGVWMTAVVFLWDVAIIYFLSTSQVRRQFAGLAYYLDKATGAVLGIIGITIVKSAIAK